MNVLIKLAYDGTDYCGFQIQDDVPTVFGVFQDALLKILGHPTDIKGCSRTDSGVHARDFCLSFTTEKQLNLHRLPLALNANLPADIRVKEALLVPDDFHARYSSKGKEYTYYILNSHIDDPFTNKYYYKVATPLDADRMNRAARYYVGTHDFRSFMAAKSKITDCVRTVHSARVEREGDMVKFIVSADGYLYNMVRIMVGTLLDVGKGITEPEHVKQVIEATDRSRAGATVPPQGLFLTKVFYDL
ncbi:MAG: tRNA pseudouridine(38-40) synthase TruA [Oscillospiraceae bacterium]|nr:tRNA pseudouridine(38-40) synthase TruA [Oscillospiraceae bacterium]